MRIKELVNVVAICLMSCAFYGGIIYWSMSDNENVFLVD